MDSIANSFVQLGYVLQAYSEGTPSKYTTILNHAAQKACVENDWFTFDNINKAISAIAIQMLSSTAIELMMSKYTPVSNPQNIGVITAGNIPLVGFHDILCVLLSGHNLTLKPSSKDLALTNAIYETLTSINPDFKAKIHISGRSLGSVNALIATGSNNTARYIESQYINIPLIIRKNRYSVAVLQGDESIEELTALGCDIFSYFGLGCRNVSNLFIPENYNFDNLFNAFEQHKDVMDNKNYSDCFRYHKACFDITGKKYISNNFALFENKYPQFSSVPIVNYSVYKQLEEVLDFIEFNKENIQCIVSNRHIPFGRAQQPSIIDYADGVDTMHFLCNLNNK